MKFSNIKYLKLINIGKLLKRNLIMLTTTATNKNLCFTKYDTERLKIIGKSIKIIKDFNNTKKSTNSSGTSFGTIYTYLMLQYCSLIQLKLVCQTTVRLQ